MASFQKKINSYEKIVVAEVVVVVFWFYYSCSFMVMTMKKKSKNVMGKIVLDFICRKSFVLTKCLFILIYKIHIFLYSFLLTYGGIVLLMKWSNLNIIEKLFHTTFVKLFYGFYLYYKMKY